MTDCSAVNCSNRHTKDNFQTGITPQGGRWEGDGGRGSNELWAEGPQ